MVRVEATHLRLATLSAHGHLSRKSHLRHDQMKAALQIVPEFDAGDDAGPSIGSIRQKDLRPECGGRRI